MTDVCRVIEDKFRFINTIFKNEYYSKIKIENTIFIN